MTTIERFFSKVRCMPNGCWEWIACRMPGKYDYGVFRKDHSNYLAHRFAYEILIGPIPKGLTLDHLCRNPSCINPMHTEPVTLSENLNRGEHHNQNSFVTCCPKGHPYSFENTYFDKRGFRSCKECHREVNRIWMRNHYHNKRT